MAVQEVVDFVQEQELISARYLNVELQFICLNCFNALHHYETEHVSRNWYNTLAGMLYKNDVTRLHPLTTKLVGMISLATTMTACFTVGPSPERLSRIGDFLESVADYSEFKEDQQLAQGMAKLREMYSQVLKSSSNLALCDFRSEMLDLISSAIAKFWPLMKYYKGIQIQRITPPSPPKSPLPPESPRPTIPQIPSNQLSDSSDDSPNDLDQDEIASATWLNQARVSVGGGLNEGASASKEAGGQTIGAAERMDVSSGSEGEEEEEDVSSKKKRVLIVDSDCDSEIKTLRRRVSYSQTPSPVPLREVWSSDESDNVPVRSRHFRGAPAKAKRPRKSKVPWTSKEEQALIRGVQKFGAGKWKLVLLNSNDFHPSRNSCSLKDKYRILLKHGVV